MRTSRLLDSSFLVAGVTAIGLVTGLASCTGDIGGDGPLGPVPPGAEEATFSGARRLTRTEYDLTLRDLLDDTSNSGFALLPEDVNDPFDNDYHTQKVSPALIESAETLAAGAAERAVTSPTVVDKIVPCVASGPDDADCLGEFVRTFGRRALRRPLSEAEVQEYVDQFLPFAVEGDDFLLGVKLVLAAMLQDVEFLYRIEIGTPLGLPGVARLTDFEVATRLSYFLIGSTPPDWLLDDAEASKLADPGLVRIAAEKLLAEDRARDRVDRFHALWLGYHQLPHSAELVAELRAESRALVEKVVVDDRSDYLSLFRSEQTYLSDYLAGHYGYDAPGESTWVTYPDERRGILSHGTVLSSFGKFADTSPTQRGIFIRTRLLCQTIPPPPTDVDTDNPPGEEAGECKADRYAIHSQGGCAGCHNLMDPIGFGLENYDNQGRYRETDDGKPECVIEGQGTIEGVGDFSGPSELADLVIGSGELEACVVSQIYRFAVGRREGAEDDPILEGLTDGFTSSGRKFDELMLEIVSSESFGFRKEEP